MDNKKKLGIVGGMGSRAGALFLRKVIDYSPAQTDQEFLEIIFHNNSATPDRTRAIVYNEPSSLDHLLRSMDLFNQNKVEAIALACITSYYYYDSIQQRAAGVVINPLHLVTDHLRQKYAEAERIGLLATTGTLSTGLFHRELKTCNAEIVTLPPADQEGLFMRSVYMKGGLKSSRISDEARSLMFQAVGKLIAQGAEVVIGGCTEVSLGLDPNGLGLPYIDMLDLLARKTVEYCYCIEPTYINAETYG